MPFTRHSFRTGRSLVCLSLGGFTALSPLPAKGDDYPTDTLPPVRIDELRAHALQPSWDTGVITGVCGAGSTRAWEATKFCLGGMVDALFWRKSETSPGLGGYGQLSTVGFRDGRLSMGLASIIPLHSWFTLGARGGGLMRFNASGAAPGLEAYLEFGQRSFSFNQRYSLSHSLLVGLQWSAATSSLEPSTAIWLALRFDGYWLSAPALLFR